MSTAHTIAYLGPDDLTFRCSADGLDRAIARNLTIDPEDLRLAIRTRSGLDLNASVPRAALLVILSSLEEATPD